MVGVSLKRVDIVSALLMIPVVAWVFYESGRWPVPPDMGSPAWIPRGVALCLLAASLLLLWKALRGRSLTLPGRLEGADRSRVLWAAALTGGYVLLLERVGFITTTALYLFGFAFILGERRWVRIAFFAVLVPVATYLLFDTALNVPLPRGWLR